MADEAAPITETPKKASKGPSKAKKAKTAASHPKISVMVNAAIKNLKERGGSSLQAIKKYIASNYKVDIERLAPFIKKYLKTAVTTGELVQTKGKGASGSFKLKGTSGKAEGNPKAAKPAKKAKPASTTKKAAKPAKKTSVKKVTKKPKAEKKSKPAKSPKKPKAKAAAKPKPKPKKAKAAPKKAAAKKGKK